MKFSQLSQNTRILLVFQSENVICRKFGNRAFVGENVKDGVLLDVKPEEDVLVEKYLHDVKVGEKFTLPSDVIQNQNVKISDCEYTDGFTSFQHSIFSSEQVFC